MTVARILRDPKGEGLVTVSAGSDCWNPDPCSISKPSFGILTTYPTPRDDVYRLLKRSWRIARGDQRSLFPLADSTRTETARPERTSGVLLVSTDEPSTSRSHYPSTDTFPFPSGERSSALKGLSSLVSVPVERCLVSDSLRLGGEFTPGESVYCSSRVGWSGLLRGSLSVRLMIT